MEDSSDENSDDGSDVSDGSQKRVCIFIQKNTQPSRDTDKMEPGRALFEDSTPQRCIWTDFGLN